MKKILSVLLLASLLFSSVSCDNYLDVNKNEDAPDYIEENLYLSGILAAWEGCYWDIRALGPLTQMFGTTGYTSFANHYYSRGSDAAGEMWRVTYWLQGMNLENMINQALEKEAYTLAGIGYAIKAYSWDYTTKMHADMPMTDAFVPGLLSHNYDYQDVVFEKVREWANTAIEYLEMEDNYEYGTTLSTADLVYGGDKEKWLKFAHGVIVRNLSALSRKSDFVSGGYAQQLVDHAALSLQSNADGAEIAMPGGADQAQFSNYNNFWGVYRGNLDDYYQHDYATQIMTGTVPQYDQATGNKIASPNIDPKTGTVYEDWPFALAEEQIICDTSDATGHFDPRVTLRLGTNDARYYNNMSNIDSIKSWVYIGSGFTGTVGPVGTAPNIWGTRTGYVSHPTYDGTGRWLYRNDSPYIIMTAAEIQFCVAEAYWYMNNRAAAYQAWKRGVELDLEFCGDHIVTGGGPNITGQDNEGNDIYAVGGILPGGDPIAPDTYDQLADEYLHGPYVEGLGESNLTLSHIMMQKYVAAFPYGAPETWVDLRKYHYDINYSGEYPSSGNGWTETIINQKWDTDPTKVYKGFYLQPAQVEDRRSKFNDDNEGSPCYRIRPRYNSEYMWNVPSLETLKPISGTADNYHCSIPWFAYPNGYPQN